MGKKCYLYVGTDQRRTGGNMLLVSDPFWQVFAAVVLTLLHFTSWKVSILDWIGLTASYLSFITFLLWVALMLRTGEVHLCSSTEELLLQLSLSGQKKKKPQVCKYGCYGRIIPNLINHLNKGTFQDLRSWFVWGKKKKKALTSKRNLAMTKSCLRESLVHCCLRYKCSNVFVTTLFEILFWNWIYLNGTNWTQEAALDQQLLCLLAEIFSVFFGLC